MFRVLSTPLLVVVRWREDQRPVADLPRWSFGTKAFRSADNSTPFFMLILLKKFYFVNQRGWLWLIVTWFQTKSKLFHDIDFSVSEQKHVKIFITFLI